jgi:hypothetical protein
MEAGGRQLQDVLVPLMQADTPETATMLACRLAKADGQKARVHLAYFLEVPRQLPLNAPLPEEEMAAAQTLEAAEKWVRREGLTAVTHVARTRDTGEEIVHQAGVVHANMVVLSIPPEGDTPDDFTRRIAHTVLDRAPCEVILNKMPLRN